MYPKASGIKDGQGQTPYIHAVSHGMNRYVRRLLLRAVPSITSNKLHELNYNSRRMAMFLTFTAVAGSTEINTRRKIRIQNKIYFHMLCHFCKKLFNRNS